MNEIEILETDPKAWSFVVPPKFSAGLIEYLGFTLFLVSICARDCSSATKSVTMSVKLLGF